MAERFDALTAYQALPRDERSSASADGKSRLLTEGGGAIRDLDRPAGSHLCVPLLQLASTDVLDLARALLNQSVITGCSSRDRTETDGFAATRAESK